MAEPKVAKDANALKAVGTFSGYKTKANLEILLTILFTEAELANSLLFISGIGRLFALEATQALEDPKAKAKTIPLGTYTIHTIKIDKNGNAKVTFKSDKDQAVPANIHQLMQEEASFIFTANITKNTEEE